MSRKAQLAATSCGPRKTNVARPGSKRTAGARFEHCSQQRVNARGIARLQNDLDTVTVAFLQNTLTVWVATSSLIGSTLLLGHFYYFSFFLRVGEGC